MYHSTTVITTLGTRQCQLHCPPSVTPIRSLVGDEAYPCTVPRSDCWRSVPDRPHAVVRSSGKQLHQSVPSGRARQSCVRGSGTAGSVRLSLCSLLTTARNSAKRYDPVPVPHFRDGTRSVFELRSLTAHRLPEALQVRFTDAVAAITSGATPRGSSGRPITHPNPVGCHPPWKLRPADHPPQSGWAPLLCDAIPHKHRCNLLRSC